MDMTVDFSIPAVRWIVECGFFLIGASLGSFLNVCFWRIPRNESIVTTPSHCTNCQHKIAWFDNLPILSFLILRGRCRHCHTPYSPRYFFVELTTALLFAAFAATGIFFNWTPEFFLIPGCAALYFAIAIAWFDFRYCVIPRGVTVTAFVAGVILAGCFPRHYGVFKSAEAMFLATAGGIGFYLALALFAQIGKRLARREVLGGGDIKAAAAIATLLTWKGAFFILFAATLTGVISGSILAIAAHRQFKRQSVAFGIDLAVGIVLWCFAKEAIVALPVFCALR
ncbi:MAG: prepilin peptidase [Victivallaceae bacterium]|nr:prepilin peptidase [Victivallaceae bacterium]